MTDVLLDDFGRPDGPIGSSWTDLYGVWSVQGGQAVCSSATDVSRTWFDPGVAVSAVGATVTIPSSSSVFTSGVTLGQEVCVAAEISWIWGDYYLSIYTYGTGTANYIAFIGQTVISPSGASCDVRLVLTGGALPSPTVEVFLDGVSTFTYTGPELAGLPNGVGLVANVVTSGSVTAPLDDLVASMDAVPVGPVPVPVLSGGVMQVAQPSSVVFAPEVRAQLLSGGPVAPLHDLDLRDVFVDDVEAAPLFGGVEVTWSDTPAASIPSTPPHTWPPGMQYGPPAATLTVSGFPDRTQASCRPELNGPGSGSCTVLPPGPGVGATVSFISGGGPVFAGAAESVTTVIADPSEEAGQLVSVDVVGHLAADWGDTVVFPDFGGDDPSRIGQPAQDEREWGWPMNGLLPDDLTFTGAVGNDPTRYGTADEVFPLPPDWPDSDARWMWDRDPDQLHAPEGWCYFRVPFGAWPGRYTLFVNAYDYARVWIDGQPIATCDQPGTTVRTELDLDWDFHLLAVAGWNSGGKAGIALSLLPKDKHGFGPAVMNSRAGWLCLSYPRTPMRATTGKILGRMLREARRRKAPAGEWSLAFSDRTDSRGHPWPTDGPLVTTKVGSSYLDVLNSFAEDRIDYWVSPGAKVLNAVVKGTGAEAHPMPWTHAVDADSIAQRIGGH